MGKLIIHQKKLRGKYEVKQYVIYLSARYSSVLELQKLEKLNKKLVYVLVSEKPIETPTETENQCSRNIDIDELRDFLDEVDSLFAFFIRKIASVGVVFSDEENNRIRAFVEKLNKIREMVIGHE